MITVYDATGGKLKPRDETGNLSTRVWIDLQNPAEDEDKAIEQALGIEVPTRSEMREIEASNRFYTENGAYYMTGVILHNSSQDVPMTSGTLRGRDLPASEPGQRPQPGLHADGRGGPYRPTRSWIALKNWTTRAR